MKKKDVCCECGLEYLDKKKRNYVMYFKGKCWHSLCYDKLYLKDLNKKYGGRWKNENARAIQSSIENNKRRQEKDRSISRYRLV